MILNLRAHEIQCLKVYLGGFPLQVEWFVLHRAPADRRIGDTLASVHNLTYDIRTKLSSIFARAARSDSPLCFFEAS